MQGRSALISMHAFYIHGLLSNTELCGYVLYGCVSIFHANGEFSWTYIHTSDIEKLVKFIK